MQLDLLVLINTKHNIIALEGILDKGSTNILKLEPRTFHQVCSLFIFNYRICVQNVHSIKINVAVVDAFDGSLLLLLVVFVTEILIVQQQG